MQKLTIQIPDNKITFFTELVNALGFKVDKSTPKSILTPEQIELVKIECKKIKDDPDDFKDWEDVRKTFNCD